MQRKRGIAIFAKKQIRTALFLCKKSGKWKETRAFKSLQEIQEVFTQEAEAAKSQGESPRPFWVRREFLGFTGLGLVSGLGVEGLRGCRVPCG